MTDNWMDERERQLRERDDRALRDIRRSAAEDRTWARSPDRDRIFGERESGASYGGASTRSYRGGSAAGGWQVRDYGGVSPAMRQGAYDRNPRFTSQDYTGGGRFYGDDDRERIYREEFGMGGYDAQRSPTRERYHEAGYSHPGFGGYGDAGRRASRGDQFEDAGRGAGEFLHRAGEKMASWFGGGGEARAYDPGSYDSPARRDARGLGPQGYKRSDERISDNAHERLTDDIWLDASHIALSVSSGEVTLSGTVETREGKHRAERLIEDLSGVTYVQNNLRIAKAIPLTSSRAGIGDGVLGDRTRSDPTANGTGGVGGGQSTAGRKT